MKQDESFQIAMIGVRYIAIHIHGRSTGEKPKAN